MRIARYKNKKRVSNTAAADKTAATFTVIELTEYRKRIFLGNYIIRNSSPEKNKNGRQLIISNINGKKAPLGKTKTEGAYGNAEGMKKGNATEIVDVRKRDPSYRYGIAKAAKLIQKGRVLVFPTETVYGLGANAFDSNAVKRIYQIKNRALDNPLIVHVNSIEMARSLVTEFNEDAQKLASVFWPGPLTLVLPKSISIPDEVTARLDTVAIRWPSDKVALDLISAAGVPIAAPSANMSGRPSVTRAAHAFEELKGKVKLILDGGMSKIGIESTVISLVHSTPIILREGKISSEQIEDILHKKVEKCKEHCDKPMSPGMKYTHYSPDAKIYVAKRNDGRLRAIYSMMCCGEKLKENKKSVIFVFSSEIPKSMSKRISEIGKVICFKTQEKMAHEIFDIFRKADSEKTHAIIIEGVPEHGLGSAIMDRLMKAADEEIKTDIIV